MSNLFIVDQVDYWTLQYARRIKLRKGHVRIISFDQNWKDFSDDCLIISPEKIKKTILDLDSYILERTDSRYNVAKVVGNNFRPDPNSTYTVRIKYSVSAKNDSDRIVLSANFYGEEGRRDFDQIHTTLPIEKSWNTIEITVKTDNFRSDEYVNFRLWNISSDADTKIRIHEVTISKESEVCEIISEAIEKHTNIHTYLSIKIFESILTWLQQTKKCVILSDIDLYRCDINAPNFSFKSYCYKKHLVIHPTSLCDIVKSDHSLENTTDGFVIEENRIISADTLVNISLDNNPREKSECLIAPATIVFSNVPRGNICFMASPETRTSLRKSLPRNKLDQTIFYDSDIGLDNILLLIVVDELKEQYIKQLLIRCWASGTVVATIDSIPIELKNSPIIQTNINEAYDLINNKNLLEKYREFGYLAAKCRSPSAVKLDIESLIFHSIGNIDDKNNRD